MTLLLMLPLLLSTEDAPLLPTGTSPAFQATAYKVETLLQANKFEEAAKLAKMLPRHSVTLSWDDSKVPSELRGRFAAARDEAIKDWTSKIPNFQITIADKGDIKCSFELTLPPPPDSVLPSGAVFFTSDGPNDARIEAVIALKRETPPVKIDPINVKNEVGYAIGAYLGLAGLPRPGGYMGRNDYSTTLQMNVLPWEIKLSGTTLDIADTLRKAAETKTSMIPRKPIMRVNPSQLKADPVVQGAPMRFSLEVVNQGNAPLMLSTYTECGCVQISAPTSVQPGMSGIIQVNVQTAVIEGRLEKSFDIFSNDPDQTQKTIMVSSFVQPVVRFLRKEGFGPIVMSNDGLKQDIYMAIDPSASFNVKKVAIQGIKGVADFEPWEGDMADPELGQPTKHRKGYKISVLVSPTAQTGRIPMTLAVTTDDPQSPLIYGTFMVQWGIVALPERLNFGEINRKDITAYFLVSRPGQPFKIKSVKSDNDFVTVSAEPFRTDIRVSVLISGQVPYGNLDATITVETDDPKQPEIKVPLRAIVK